MRSMPIFFKMRVSQLSSQQDKWTSRIILSISLIAAIWLTLIYYPGVMLSDSYRRWTLVEHLFNTGGSNKDAIVPALWMALNYGLTHNYASFSLFQSFFFFYSSFSLMCIMGRFKGVWMALPIMLFLAFPIFQGYSVFHENSVGTIIGINFTLILLSHDETKTNELKQVIYFFICFLVFSTLFGFRQNNITLLPVIILMLYRAYKHKKTNTHIQIWSLAAALVFVYCLPILVEKYRSIRNLQEINLALTWETAQIIERSQDPKEAHYLDYLGDTPQATEKALINVREEILDMLKADGLSWGKIFEPSFTKRVIKDYLNIVFTHPKEFIQTKIYSWGRILGITRPIYFWGFWENKSNWLPKYGYRPTELRHQQFVRIGRLVDTCKVLTRPFILFILGGIMVFLSKRYLNKEVEYVGIAFTLAIFYYGGFFLINESYEFRYFFPSFYLNVVIGLVVLTKFIEVGCRAKD
jgi:hypothetical protein